MKGKIADLQEARAEVENLRATDENFAEKVTQLLNKTTKHLGEIDDQQEINWCAKSFDITQRIRNGEIKEDQVEKKDLALTYLKEALDSVITRERRYLE